MKKLLPFLTTSLACLTSVVSAVDDMQVRNLENRVNALEQRRGANGMINPPARPVVKDGIDLWIQAEALYMHATEDGVNYGIKQENSSFFDGTVKNISYDWSWGWRVGAGYNIPHDGWDLMLNYTWFRANEDNSSNPDAPENVLQTWTNPTLIDPTSSDPIANMPAAHAKGITHLKFDYLDFEMGREFFVSKWLTLRPFVGGRGLWAHRDLKVKYSGGSLSGIKLKEKFNNRFRGGGLRAGLDSQWGLGMGWSFFGDVAFSLLYGKTSPP